MPEGIRPSQNILRKAIFDILGGDLEGVEVLELFSGSGAIGLEALSRGAKKVAFVEKDPKCAEVIKANIEILQDKEQWEDRLCWELLNTDAFVAIKMFKGKGRCFDIIFIDPPYGRGLAKKCLKTIGAYDILHPNSLLLIEHKKDETLPPQEGRFFLYRQKKYGGTFLTIYKIKE